MVERMDTQRNTLPVVEHMLGVYKVWFGLRDHFPKKARYTLGDKIDNRFLNVLELLSVAAFQGAYQKTPTLERALVAADALKFLLRVAWELKLLEDARYAELSQGVQEVSRQIGGWKKGLEKKTPAR